MDKDEIAPPSKEGEVWPPPPTLAAPALPQLTDFERIPIWVLLCIAAGMGLVNSGVYYWVQCSHSRLIRWDNVLEAGLTLALPLFGGFLRTRYVHRRRRRNTSEATENYESLGEQGREPER